LGPLFHAWRWDVNDWQPNANADFFELLDKVHTVGKNGHRASLAQPAIKFISAPVFRAMAKSNQQVRVDITIHFAITGSDCTHATFHNVALDNGQGIHRWAEKAAEQLGLKVFSVSSRVNTPTRRVQTA